MQGNDVAATNSIETIVDGIRSVGNDSSPENETMSTMTAPPPKPRHQFTVVQYFQMVDAGILDSRDRVELIHGEIRPKMAKGIKHDGAVENLSRLIGRMIPDDLAHRCQSVLTLPDSAPEPDFVICTSRTSRKGKHPKASETFLVIEVSDTSLSDDQNERLELFAANLIPEYWIVNIPDQQIEVYTLPETPFDSPARYNSQVDYVTGQSVPLRIEGRDLGAIGVAAVLG